MKKLLVLILIYSLISCSSDSPTEISENIFTGDVSLNTQEEVDSFGSNNYTEIIGDLYIGDPNFVTDINSLEILSTLQKVGNLNISVDELTSFNGLNNLTTVNGDCSIRSVNNEMENFVGLNNLTEIIGSFGFGRSYFQNLTGLENLNSIGGSLFIGAGYQLNTLTGFSISTIGGDLKLENCDLLTEVAGMESLISVNGNLYIQDNELLSDFCDLTDFFTSGSYNEVTITDNLYNPTLEDILNNNCSL